MLVLLHINLHLGGGRVLRAAPSPQEVPDAELAGLGPETYTRVEATPKPTAPPPAVTPAPAQPASTAPVRPRRVK